MYHFKKNPKCQVKRQKCHWRLKQKKEEKKRITLVTAFPAQRQGVPELLQPLLVVAGPRPILSLPLALPLALPLIPPLILPASPPFPKPVTQRTNGNKPNSKLELVGF